jgi:aspartyl-tRNA(Asn)/glutamyl-tRNA(Gln) amidotransferase subunit A
MRLPVGRISGAALNALVSATRAPPLRALLAQQVRAELGIDAARKRGREVRGVVPFSLQPRRARTVHARPSEELPLPSRETWPRGVRELTEAYRSGRVTPDLVVQRALAAARAIDARQPGPFCDYADERALSEARASAERFRCGAPGGVLDGIPISVKEEIDVEGFATRLGTSFLGQEPAGSDALFVRRLREAGAIVIAQTPMTEYGLSPLGANPHRRMPRNTHDSGRLAGGSSTGSAVAVSLGLVPLALGTDGGGSIRVPAAYNGVFGLKPSYGRIPVTGHGMLGGTSVVHFGPIGASSHELALALELGAGPDDGDSASLLQPPFEPGEFTRALGRGVRGLRLGVVESDFREAHDDVARPGREALRALERDGATLVSVELPLARHAAAVGYLTIAVEALAGLREVQARYERSLAPDLQLFLRGVEGFAPDDYVDAQRLREAMRAEAAHALAGVDVLVSPTTRTVAPRVTEAEARSGFIDTVALDAACRYVFAGNLLGLPAGTAPVGRSDSGLPAGLQIMGDAWDEACVLQVLAALERAGVARAIRPPAAVDLLA